MPSATLLLALVLSQSGVDALIEDLKTEDPARQRKALEDLSRQGAAAVPAVLRAIENVNPGLAERVAALVRKLSSKKWMERDEAMQGLVRMGRYAKAALAEHENAGDPETAWRVRAALAEMTDRAGREELLEEYRNAALCEFLGGAGDARAVKALARLVGKSPARVQVKAAEALGRLRGALEPAQADEAAERVLEAMERTREARLRGVYIRALGALRSEVAVRPLSGLLADKSEKNLHVKRSCAASLAAVGTAPALRAVILALSSDDPYLRDGAAAALEPLAGEVPGFDPRSGAAENGAAIETFQAWWSRKFSRAWEE